MINNNNNFGYELLKYTLYLTSSYLSRTTDIFYSSPAHSY